VCTVDRERASEGFHFALGAGPSGHFAAGFAVQLKAGVRLTPKLRVFGLLLDHVYVKTDRVTSGDQLLNVSQWRFSVMGGVGVDYFVLPRVGVRGAIGVGGDYTAELGKDPMATGYSYLMGMTFELFDGDHRLAIDPFIHMLQHNRANLEPGTGNQWLSRPIIGVTANWTFR